MIKLIKWINGFKKPVSIVWVTLAGMMFPHCPIVEDIPIPLNDVRNAE